MGAKNKRSKPAAKYQGFALEIPLIDEIKKYIKDKPEYRSVTDFVRSAIREKISRDTLNTVLEMDSDKMSKRIEKLEETIEKLCKESKRSD
jgi:hypothetical protein